MMMHHSVLLHQTDLTETDGKIILKCIELYLKETGPG
jgi:hypothetical protein